MALNPRSHKFPAEVCWLSSLRPFSLAVILNAVKDLSDRFFASLRMTMNKKLLFLICSAAISAALLTSNFAAAANLSQAVSVLPQDDEWAIMAYAAMGQNVGQSFLSQPVTSGIATDVEKRILAITAQGGDAQSFVTELECLTNSGQIGDSSLINDDSFGILALNSAGVSDNVTASSRS